MNIAIRMAEAPTYTPLYQRFRETVEQLNRADEAANDTALDAYWSVINGLEAEAADTPAVGLAEIALRLGCAMGKINMIYDLSARGRDIGERLDELEGFLEIALAGLDELAAFDVDLYRRPTR